MYKHSLHKTISTHLYSNIINIVPNNTVNQQALHRITYLTNPFAVRFELLPLASDFSWLGPLLQLIIIVSLSLAQYSYLLLRDWCCFLTSLSLFCLSINSFNLSSILETFRASFISSSLNLKY